MNNPIILTISTGRCGTTFLYNSFYKSIPSQVYLYHESLHPNVGKPAFYHRSYSQETQKEILNNSSIKRQIDEWLKLAEQKPVIEFGWTTSSLVPTLRSLIGNQLRVIFLHRHPISVAASFVNKGHYSKNKNPAWAISPMHKRVAFPEYQKFWPSMTPFEKSLYRWLEINNYGLEISKKYPDLQVLEIPSHRLFTSQEVLCQIGSFCGVDNPELINASNETNEQNLCDRELRPVRQEYQKYLNYGHIINLAEKLDYDMTIECAKSIASKYTMPNRLASLMRRYAGYWHARFYAGAFKQYIQSIIDNQIK